jgi:hypothetical protein
MLGREMCNLRHPVTNVFIKCTGEEDVEIAPCSFGISEVRFAFFNAMQTPNLLEPVYAGTKRADERVTDIISD